MYESSHSSRQQRERSHFPHTSRLGLAGRSLQASPATNASNDWLQFEGGVALVGFCRNMSLRPVLTPCAEGLGVSLRQLPRYEDCQDRYAAQWIGQWQSPRTNERVGHQLHTSNRCGAACALFAFGQHGRRRPTARRPRVCLASRCPCIGAVLYLGTSRQDGRKRPWLPKVSKT